MTQSVHFEWQTVCHRQHWTMETKSFTTESKSFTVEIMEWLNSTEFEGPRWAIEKKNEKNIQRWIVLSVEQQL